MSSQRKPTYVLKMDDIDFKLVTSLESTSQEHLSEDEKKLADQKYCKCVLWSSRVAYDRGWNTAYTYAYVSNEHPGEIWITDDETSETTQRHKRFGPKEYVGYGQDVGALTDLRDSLVILSKQLKQWDEQIIEEMKEHLTSDCLGVVEHYLFEKYNEWIKTNFPRHRSSFGQVRGN